MSTPLLWLVTFIYAGVALDQARKGNWMALVFGGYVLANIGLILAMRSQ